jgi:hypothetical protein
VIGPCDVLSSPVRPVHEVVREDRGVALLTNRPCAPIRKSTSCDNVISKKNAARAAITARVKLNQQSCTSKARTDDSNVRRRETCQRRLLSRDTH